MTDPHELDVFDMAAELTRPHQHRETYTSRVGETTFSRGHITRVPALLDQLQHAAPSGAGTTRAAGYESRPAARIEALDALIWVDREASAWLRDLGQDDPDTTAACVRQLAALYPSLDVCGRVPKKPRCCTRHDVERDVRRWYTQARIVTGWDVPAWRPDSTCPNCEARGSLRVRLEDRFAMCTDCRETWDATSYQQLANHVRSESEEARAASRVEPCRLREDGVTELGVMCPRCGSMRCVNAIHATKRKLATGEWAALSVAPAKIRTEEG